MTLGRSSLAERFRLLCVLGRISNLPTVWSNCLAGWLLGGGGEASDFAWLCAGATCLYTGGMFLNDAVDVEWDRQQRAERPIPSGRITRRSVGFGAGLCLVAGCLLLFAAGRHVGVLGLALTAGIVLYDVIHKRVGFAPLLMAACRALLYFTAAAAANGGMTKPVLLGALAMAAYVAGLSFLARREGERTATARWPMALVLAPIGLQLPCEFVRSGFPTLAAASAGCLLWSVWCLQAAFRRPQPQLGRCVSGLLAGIPLVDWLAVAGADAFFGLGFVGLFLLARWLQKIAPAT